MQSNYNLKVDLSVTALMEESELYNIILESNKDFDNSFINFFGCANIKIKSNPHPLIKINSIKKTSKISKKSTQKNNSFDSLSMKNIKTNNPAFLNQLKILKKQVFLQKEN